MLNVADRQALATVRAFLADAGYAYLSARFVPGHDSLVFAPFATLQDAFRGLSGPCRFLLSLLRQGHPVDDAVLRRAWPGDVIDAFESVGLLRRDRPDEWRTNGVVLVPLHGLQLAVSLPPHYPTADSRQQPVYLGMESIWLSHTLPPVCNGLRVLDVCAGSGIQGLLCAARGAARVVALEFNLEALATARFNAALNGLEDRFEIRSSDLYASVAPGETFDRIVSNPPFMPVMPDIGYPVCGDGGADGTRLLRRLLEDLPPRLAPRGEALIYCNVLGTRNSIPFNERIVRAVAESHGLRAQILVDDKQPMSEYANGTLRINLEHVRPDLDPDTRQALTEGWLEALARDGIAAEAIYSQVIRLRRDAGPAGLEVRAAYDPRRTDPLFARAGRVRAGA